MKRFNLEAVDRHNGQGVSCSTMYIGSKEFHDSGKSGTRQNTEECHSRFCQRPNGCAYICSDYDQHTRLADCHRMHVNFFCRLKRTAICVVGDMREQYATRGAQSAGICEGTAIHNQDNRSLVPALEAT